MSTNPMVQTAYSLIGEVRLRNSYFVYASANDYTVVALDRHGDRHEQTFEFESVDFVADLLDGEEVTVDQALNTIEPLVDERVIQFPFTYGYKLRFYLQSILIILVATGRAELRRDRRAFIYRINNV